MDSQLKPAKKKEVRYFGSIEKIKPVESIESILNSLETEKDREFFTKIFEGRKNKSAKTLTLGQNKKKESLININEILLKSLNENAVENAQALTEVARKEIPRNIAS